MEQNPCGEAHSHSIGQKIFRVFMETKGLLPRSKQPATGPYSESL
jgi:hypothetical protein